MAESDRLTSTKAWLFLLFFAAIISIEICFRM